MPRLVLYSGSEEETLDIGEALGRVLRAGDLLALVGDLGAGKTRLVRGMARGMGLDEGAVSSPTYVIAHEYAPPPHRPLAPPLIHIDAYRLGDGSGRADEDELESLGWDRLADGSGVLAIEWPDRIAHLLDAGWPPELRAAVRITNTGETSRRLDLTTPESWSARPEFHALASLSRASSGNGAHTGGGAGVLPEGRADDPELGPLPPGWARCPVTGRGVPPDSPTFPFADERARWADLGKWMRGDYVVSRELTEDDLAEDPGPGTAPAG